MPSGMTFDPVYGIVVTKRIITKEVHMPGSKVNAIIGIILGAIAIFISIVVFFIGIEADSNMFIGTGEIIALVISIAGLVFGILSIRSAFRNRIGKGASIAALAVSGAGAGTSVCGLLLVGFIALIQSF